MLEFEAAGVEARIVGENAELFTLALDRSVSTARTFDVVETTGVLKAEGRAPFIIFFEVRDGTTRGSREDTIIPALVLLENELTGFHLTLKEAQLLVDVALTSMEATTIPIARSILMMMRTMPPMQITEFLRFRARRAFLTRMV